VFFYSIKVVVLTDRAAAASVGRVGGNIVLRKEADGTIVATFPPRQRRFEQFDRGAGRKRQIGRLGAVKLVQRRCCANHLLTSGRRWLHL
jgi:hypothetical protein